MLTKNILKARKLLDTSEQYVNMKQLEPDCNIIKTWVKQELQMSKFPIFFQFTPIEALFLPPTHTSTKLEVYPLKSHKCVPVYLS